MANTIKIKANFYGSCSVVKNGKIEYSGVDYEFSRRKCEETGGEIWQEFMDDDGYIGFVRRPYDCSVKD